VFAPVLAHVILTDAQLDVLSRLEHAVLLL
jgi:hypothetical protein